MEVLMERKQFFTSKNIAYLAVLLALVVVLQIVGTLIGRLGVTAPSLVLIPIVLGGILLGTAAGSLLGFIFGVVVIVMGATGLDGFTSILLAEQPLLTVLLCLVKGTAAGFVAGILNTVIGKKNHPEIIGTIGQLRHPEKVHVIYSPEEAEQLVIAPDVPVGFVTQTTLSVDDTAEIIAVLQKKIKNLLAMSRSDICFATTNRQSAVKALAARTPVVVIIGSANSSNSRQLKETALKSGAEKAFLIDNAAELDFAEIGDSIGISAGASAPEKLVEDLLTELKVHYDKIKIHHVNSVKKG